MTSQAPTPWKVLHYDGGRFWIDDANGRTIFTVSDQNRTTDAQREIADAIVSAVNAAHPSQEAQGMAREGPPERPRIAGTASRRGRHPCGASKPNCGGCPDCGPAAVGGV